MKYLFIGGEADGKRMEVEDCVLTHIVTTDRPTLPEQSFSDREKLIYTKRRMTVANGLAIAYVSFFALESMTMAEALNKLVEGYRV